MPKKGDRTNSESLDFAGPAPTGDDPASKRARKLHKLIQEVNRLRGEGKQISDQQVMDKYPELLPELAEALAWLSKVDAAEDHDDADAFPVGALRPTPPESDMNQTISDAQAADALEDITLEQTIVDDQADTVATTEDPEPLPNIEIDGYTIIRKISQGGQAIVFLGQQNSTGKRVAIKIMWEGPFAQAREKARFDREVQILAALEHPNIVSVIDKGATAHGALFFVMNYIDGQPLDEWVEANRNASSSSRQPLDPGELLRIFMRICDAVNAAHLRGVIHRDLKPSNILIDSYGEPHILDFGLARTAINAMTDEDNPQPVTVTGKFIGSLPWASPEQAEGVASKIDVRTDVYSLGVILYQMLTGQFPYEVVGNMRDVLDNIMTAHPTPPSKVMEAKLAKAATRRRKMRKHHRNPINQELESIVLHALEKQPDRRYQSAGELSRDIANYISGKPTAAAGVTHRSGSLSDSLLGHPGVRIAALVLVVLIGGLVSTYMLGLFDDNEQMQKPPVTTANTNTSVAQPEQGDDDTPPMTATASFVPTTQTSSSPTPKPDESASTSSTASTQNAPPPVATTAATTSEPSPAATSATPGATTNPNESQTQLALANPTDPSVLPTELAEMLEEHRQSKNDASSNTTTSTNATDDFPEPSETTHQPPPPPASTASSDPPPPPDFGTPVGEGPGSSRNVLIHPGREDFKNARRLEAVTLLQNMQFHPNATTGVLLPIRIEGSYELVVKFTPRTADDGFLVRLPSSDRRMKTIVVNYHGLMGLGNVAGKSLLKNDTATQVAFEPGQEAEVRFFITDTDDEVVMRGWVGDEEKLRYRGKAIDFETAPERDGAAMPLPMRISALPDCNVLINEVFLKLENRESEIGPMLGPGQQRPGRPGGEGNDRRPPFPRPR